MVLRLLCFAALRMSLPRSLLSSLIRTRTTCRAILGLDLQLFAKHFQTYM